MQEKASENTPAKNLPNAGDLPSSPGNALKHGAFSEILILPGEDPKEFEKLKNALFAEYKPSGVSEEKTMTSIAVAHWQERRLPLYQYAQFLRARKSGFGRSEKDPLESNYAAWNKAAQGAKTPIPSDAYEPDDDPWKKISGRAHDAEKSFDDALLELGDRLTLEHFDKELEVENKIQSKTDRLYKRFFQMKAMKQIAGLGETPARRQISATPVLELEAVDPIKPSEE